MRFRFGKECSSLRRLLIKTLKLLLPRQLWPVDYLTRLAIEKTNTRVISGPFCGMRYIAKAHGSALLPKLLGIYERELWQVVDRLVALDLDTLFVLGAAEGYYAVGIALRKPDSRVLAYESAPEARESIKELCSLNQASRNVVIRGEATPDLLCADMGLSGRVGVLCDVEGAELQLLDPATNRALTAAHILVEVHEFVHRGITSTLMKRFEATHDIEHILEADRSIEDYPFRTLYSWILPNRYKLAVISEMRPERMSWLWMRPKAHA